MSLGLYKWLDRGNCAGLTPAVRKALNDVGQAKLWDYQDRCEVVHYVCPVFPTEEMDTEKALEMLTDVYTGIFGAFMEADGTVLRMAPVGAGASVGSLQDKLHYLTPQAVTTAFMNLDDDVVEKMLEQGERVQICVCKVREQRAYGAEFDLEFSLCREDAERAGE